MKTNLCKNYSLTTYYTIKAEVDFKKWTVYYYYFSQINYYTSFVLSFYADQCILISICLLNIYCLISSL